MVGGRAVPGTLISMGGEGEMSGGLLTVEVAQGSLCLGSGLWGLKAEGCLGLWRKGS